MAKFVNRAWLTWLLLACTTVTIIALKTLFPRISPNILGGILVVGLLPTLTALALTWRHIIPAARSQTGDAYENTVPMNPILRLLDRHPLVFGFGLTAAVIIGCGAWLVASHRQG
ncbi:MAG: hypothetical protein ACYDGR_02440 [Candidatus Dormibacteria bacterium]